MVIGDKVIGTIAGCDGGSCGGGTIVLGGCTGEIVGAIVLGADIIGCTGVTAAGGNIVGTWVAFTTGATGIGATGGTVVVLPQV